MEHHIIEGESHLSAGRLHKALRCFELQLELAPDHHRAIYFSALVHLKMGQEATALVQFNRALELHPDNPNYLADLAVTKLRLSDKDGALRDLDRCVVLDPNNSYRYSLRAFARNSMGDVQGAVDDYRKAVELDPEDSIAVNNLGLAEESMGYNDLAHQRFALADRLSGVYSTPKDHTIDLSRKKQTSFQSDITEQEAVESVESDVFHSYWDTIKRVFTDKEQRNEFLRFTRNGFRTDAK